MPLDAPVAAAIAFVIAAFALALVLVLVARIARLQRAYDGLVGDGSFLEVAERTARSHATLLGEVANLRVDVAAARADVGNALRHIGIVRYDAFGDLSGVLSFSVALLDDAGNGVVVSSINGRTDARTYAKEVRGWASEQPLSPEEKEAVNRALHSA